ncbi:hypothetical protein E4K67_29110 [Desulfosporosinus fructosivorans]|uniref:Uncharacterized protein n=1 Tax=Desulfosporosinus fructosivorans TaxID=2018669 RepID=A0A4Z0QXL8_9FIRM|nr:hypothetical protein [Desulfosporosinus fructosivorans]TGE34755.1 hypothetical protein E4K67_29110 [Desulfosporosinus fructosivorans]
MGLFDYEAWKDRIATVQILLAWQHTSQNQNDNISSLKDENEITRTESISNCHTANTRLWELSGSLCTRYEILPKSASIVKTPIQIILHKTFIYCVDYIVRVYLSLY